MQPSKPSQVRSAINVTPLVDVVLVLLIIFMVVAPQLQAGPALKLPTTDEPPEKSDAGRQIVVAIERDGTVWVDGRPVTAEEFPQRIRETAVLHADWQVVIQGDARLTFGEVKQVMLSVESAGFKDVGLIAERNAETGAGS
jgi:biopolymer transport protein TolR